MCSSSKILSGTNYYGLIWKGSKAVFDAVGKDKFTKKGSNHIITNPVDAHQAVKDLEKLWNDEDAQKAMKVTTKTDHFIFEFETNGAMKANLALEQALEAFNTHCTEFATDSKSAA